MATLLRHIKRAKDRRYFDTRVNKFISKKEFARRRKIVARFRKPAKRKIQKRKPFKAKTVEGSNYIQRVRIEISDSINPPQDEIIERRVEGVFRKGTLRLQKKNRFIFIKLEGSFIIGVNDVPRGFFTRSFDFADAVKGYDRTLGVDIKDTLEEIRDQIQNEFYDEGIIEAYVLKRIIVSIRRPRKRRKVRRKRG